MLGRNAIKEIKSNSSCVNGMREEKYRRKYCCASVVVPIHKLSIVVSVVFSYFIFHEHLSKKSVLGLVLIVAGTLIMLIPK